MDRIVCKCAGVLVKDLKKFLQEYPEIQKDQLKDILNIGYACKSCLHKDSPIIDVHFSDAINESSSFINKNIQEDL